MDNRYKDTQSFINHIRQIADDNSTGETVNQNTQCLIQGDYFKDLIYNIDSALARIMPIRDLILGKMYEAQKKHLDELLTTYEKWNNKFDMDEYAQAKDQISNFYEDFDQEFSRILDTLFTKPIRYLLTALLADKEIQTLRTIESRNLAYGVMVSYKTLDLVDTLYNHLRTIPVGNIEKTALSNYPLKIGNIT